MTEPEIFFLGVFCGAYAMFTLVGMIWCGKRKPSGRTRTVDTKGEEQA